MLLLESESYGRRGLDKEFAKLTAIFRSVGAQKHAQLHDGCVPRSVPLHAHSRCTCNLASRVPSRCTCQ